MLLGGDEIRRSQNGNNNAYNQDNATSWFDWTLVDSNRRDAAFRPADDRVSESASGARGSGRSTPARSTIEVCPDITWHGTTLDSPGFDDPQARALACTIAGFGGTADLHVMMNMFWEPLDFEVPASGTWRLAIDTDARDPRDIDDPGGGKSQLAGHRYPVPGRSIIVLTRSVSE